MAIILLILCTALLVFGDQYCKNWIEKHLRKGDRERIGKSSVEMRRAHNKGFAMNFCDKKPEYVRIISCVICVFVAVWALFVWKEENCLVKRIAAAVMLAGAISNTYDRMKREYVVDYIGVRTKCDAIRKITFNLADIMIFVGAVSYSFAEIFGTK